MIINFKENKKGAMNKNTAFLMNGIPGNVYS